MAGNSIGGSLDISAIKNTLERVDSLLSDDLGDDFIQDKPFDATNGTRSI